MPGRAEAVQQQEPAFDTIGGDGLVFLEGRPARPRQPVFEEKQPRETPAPPAGWWGTDARGWVNPKVSVEGLFDLTIYNDAAKNLGM